MNATLKSINEEVFHDTQGEGCTDQFTFKCSKRLAVALRRTALVNRVEVSGLIRVLLREGMEAREISLDL